VVNGVLNRKGSAKYKSSRYSFMIPTEDGVMLYSAMSGAVLKLSGLDGQQVAKSVSGSPRNVSTRALPEDVLESLIEGGFLIPEDRSEMAQIKSRFQTARIATPMVITITTTLDCNLGCYYCYEERSEEHLENADIESLRVFVKERLIRSQKKTLHVDWYGGEPLLNQKFIDQAAPQLQETCRELNVAYSASIISNGTCWPDDVENFVTRNSIRQVQISFDGLQKNHDKTRRYREKAPRHLRQSSFLEAVALVDRLVNIVRVDLRYNISKRNASDLLPFYLFAENRGWFNATYPPVIQPARVSAYTERSSFLRSQELSEEEYSTLRQSLHTKFGRHVRIEEAEVPDGFPFPKTTVCAALASDSAVIGADKRIYRCGLQVSERDKSIAGLTGVRFRGIPINVESRALDTLQTSQRDWWNSFDPTTLPTCSRCSFLPICWAGCPKKHLDGDAHAIMEQGRYWRGNLSRLLLTAFPDEKASPIEYTLSDQFRE
jgi:uncharacterized protein